MLDNKVTSIVQAASSGDGITDETVKNMMMNNTVEELKEKVNGMKAQGILVEQTEVSETSFIVCQETDTNGVITNPRIQFVVAALMPDLRTKILGSKVGDTVVLQEGLAGLNILEIYGVTMPKPPESAATEAAPADTSAEASTSSAVLDSAPTAASS